MSNLGINNRTPQIQHPTLIQKGAKIQRTADVKVKTRTTVDLKKMQELANQSRELGQIGTKAQITALKAEIKNMNLDGVSPPRELEALETLKKFGVDTKDGLVGGLVALKDAGKEYLFGKAITGKELHNLGEQVEKTSNTLKVKAIHCRQAKLECVGIAKQLLESLNSESTPDTLRVIDQLERANTLLKQNGFGSQHPLLQAIKQPGNPIALREAAQHLLSSEMILNVKAESLDTRSQKLTSLSEDLKKRGGSVLVGGITEGLQNASPIMASTNFISQSVYAAKNSQNLMQVVSSGKGAVMTGSGLAAFTGAVGGLQIVSEGLDLYNNAKALNSSLKKVEMSKVILADQSSRDKMVEKLEKKISALQNPGRLKKLFSSQTGRQEEISKLQSKISAIRSVPPSDQISKEAKAVATQITKRADIKFKMVKIAKNVIGIAAGAIAISVAVGLLATPVGWVAAGVAMSAGIGCACYSLSKGSSRNKKMTNATKAVNLSQQKIDLKQEQKDQIQKQMIAIQSSMQERQQTFHKGFDPTQSKKNSFNESMIADSATLKGLESKLSTLDTEIVELKSAKSKATLQLMAVSPEKASESIFEGALAGDASMKFIAEQILGVKDIAIMPKNVAISLLSKGMSIYPDF